MHRRWKKRLTGAISIFLTIIFVSNYALIGLLVDSGRLRMARAVAEGALDNAGASVLSYYNRMLYDLYGLFATDSLTEEDITRLLGDYAEKTLGTVPVEESALTSLVDAVTSAVGGLTGEDGEELPTFDLYSFDAEVTLVDGASHTLANTEAVEAQIIDHMKYRAPENLFNAATSGDSFLGKLQGLFDLTERMSVTKDKLELTGGKEALFRSASDMITKIGNFNANAFARSALEQGCRYAVVDEAQYATDDRFILVDDVLRTLQQLAAHHRRTLGTTIIGITGTNGKTTTKELVAAVLREKYRILYTQGNLNNHIGVPLTLLRLRPEHQLAVVEMGASHPGEIAELCEIARPDYGLITNVGEAHLEGFGSFEGVKQTKAALYAFVAHHGRGAFVNTDNPHLMEMAKALQPDLRVQPYVPGTVTECSPFLHMELQASCALCGAFPVHTRLIGAYNAENVRAAATVGSFFDLTDTQIRHALEHYEPQNNRSQLVRTGRNTLIVDAYNANPVSMEAAIRSFARMEAPHKMLILGEMGELGVQSGEEHRRIMQLIHENGFDHVLLVGGQFQRIAPPYPCFPDVDALREYLHLHQPDGCCILIKGSRTNRLETVVEDL